MSRERDEFIVIMSKELPVGDSAMLDWCRKLMRLAHTHGRLQEAACNGDWPAANGERSTTICPVCEKSWADGTVHPKRGCKSCRIEAQISEMCRLQNIQAIFQGDPRGATVKLKVPSGRTNDWGGEGICVPQ